MQQQWYLGKPPVIGVGIEGFCVHLGSDIRNTVAFIGYQDSRAPGGIRCIGTGVLIEYEGGGYLVTARHIAEPIGDAPFLIRVNRIGEPGANVLRGENAPWHYHPDETVDLAAVVFHATPGRGFKCLYFGTKDILTEAAAQEEYIDIGDFCYTVGLFRYMSGHERNEPVLFTGHLSLWNAKSIPIWNKYKNKFERVDGHIVQSHGIQGASGSPVLVRPALKITDLQVKRMDQKNAQPTSTTMVAVMDNFYLMGIMQGAWFLPPDELLREEVGALASDTVPVGLGIVTPSFKIIELLNMRELKAMRQKKPPEAAEMTVVPPPKTDAPTNGENPTHREDFTRLVNAAARKQPRDDQT